MVEDQLIAGDFFALFQVDRSGLVLEVDDLLVAFVGETEDGEAPSIEAWAPLLNDDWERVLTRSWCRRQVFQACARLARCSL